MKKPEGEVLEVLNTLRSQIEKIKTEGTATQGSVDVLAKIQGQVERYLKGEKSPPQYTVVRDVLNRVYINNLEDKDFDTKDLQVVGQFMGQSPKPLPPLPQKATSGGPPAKAVPELPQNAGVKLPKGESSANAVRVPPQNAPVTSAERTTRMPGPDALVGHQMIKHLMDRSRQQFEAPAPKEDPQKENMLNAFKELSTKGISYIATNALKEAESALKEGKASTDTVRTFLAAVIHPEKVKGLPVTKISGDEKDLLQKFMNTAGVQKAVETDPAIRGALKSFADKLPNNAKDIVAGPVQKAQRAHEAQKTASLKK